MLRFASLALRRFPNSSSSSQQTRSFAADTVYKFSVSPEHLETVKATLPLVGAAGTDLTKHFYARMFKNHPELQNVFNQTNQAIGGQPKKLLKTVAIAGKSTLVLFHHVNSSVQYEGDVDTSYELNLSSFDCLCNPHVLTEVRIISLSFFIYRETRIFQPKLQLIRESYQEKLLRYV